MSTGVKALVSQLTLEEKASLCSGQDIWHTQPIPRLNIPSIMVSDGPHGLRKQSDDDTLLNVNSSKVAICFPAGCCTACSFDPDLLYKLGSALGDQCVAEDVSVILGPSINIKRSPLCGRNFEYFSEDPLVATRIATGFINGVQSHNVGTSIKHFACNNQEFKRMTCSTEVDPRTIREIYLAAFEGAIKDSQPWTVMCSYNQINGVFSSENKWLLENVLRDEWGFKGFVVSDWGAVNDRVKGVEGGLDLQMPGPSKYNDELIVKAVKEGILDENILNRTCERILNIVYKYHNNKQTSTFDKEKSHQVAREVAEESIVLLKNEDSILPLHEEQKVAFIGEFAKNPRYQGGGSSHINAFRVISAVDALSENKNITYSQGYITEKDEIKPDLEREAIESAKKADVAIIFAGLPESFESEGFDRVHMRIQDCQNHLIQEIIKVQPNIVIVLHNGAPVEMPWINDVKGILEVYLGGQAVGEATANILYGKANPCGKLAETFPVRLEDNPSYGNFPGFSNKVVYREGIMVGYRYYDLRNIHVNFPFGHGLSYSTFEYSNLRVSKDNFNDNEEITVSIDVTNTSTIPGKEIVQLYVSDHSNVVERPPKELRDFAKIPLKGGETKTVTFKLGKRAFAYYNVELNDWVVPTGEYEILIGKSSRNIVRRHIVHVTTTTKVTKRIHLNSTFQELTSDPILKPLADEFISRFPDIKKAMEEGDNEFLIFVTPLVPLRSLYVIFPCDLSDVVELVEKANKLLESAH